MAGALTHFWRGLHLARTLARHDALFPAEYMALLPPSARLARRLFGSGKVKDGATPGKRLARALESLGPCYVKLGQVMATRPDIVGSDVARELEDLQDRLPSFPTADAKAVIASEFGRAPETLYAGFGDPVAAASIAQVHAAETNDTAPVRVAVKVLRPGIEAEFLRDIDTLKFAAAMAEKFSAEARRLRLVALVETLAESTALELDLRMEAAAASELAERMAGTPRFRIPAVDWNRTSARVLTTEWIDGVPVRDIEGLKAAGHDPKDVALVLMRSFLTQALREGFFHADLHPGNLFVDPQGNLVAVDFGIMGRLSPLMRRFMAETIGGFLARDYVRVAKVHFEAEFVPSHFPLETFAQAIRAVGEPIAGRPAREMSMAKVLQQLFDTTRRFEMQAQPQLLLLQKTMVVVEGVARNLDPDFDIWEASRPVVEAWMKDQLSPKARLKEAVDGLQALASVVRLMPEFAHNIGQASRMLAEGGLKLHPETARLLVPRPSLFMRALPWLALAAAVATLVWHVI